MQKTKTSKRKAAVRTKQAKQSARRLHSVRRGETLGAIARRYGTSIRALMRANALRTSHIQAGASLRIPNR